MRRGSRNLGDKGGKEIFGDCLFIHVINVYTQKNRRIISIYVINCIPLFSFQFLLGYFSIFFFKLKGEIPPLLDPPMDILRGPFSINTFLMIGE